MKKARNIIGIIALVIFVAGSAVFLLQNPTVKAPVEATGTTATGTTASATYTLADVVKHPNGTSCWTTISGNVYDLTSWVSQHPGGEAAILSICGGDGTSAFTAQHGNNRRVLAVLATFKIGTLTK